VATPAIAHTNMHWGLETVLKLLIIRTCFTITMQC